MRRGAGARAVAAAVAALGLLAGCAVQGLSFDRDHRVRILEPSQNETVTLPFDLDWSAEGFTGRFLVLFDRPPMRPGRTLRSLVPEDDSCRNRPGCPDEVWLADRNIYVTDATRLTVDRLPDLRPSNRSRDRHDVTIVLLDDEGRRAGESAFTAEFIVERED